MKQDGNNAYPLNFKLMSNQLISRVETITPVLAEEYLRHNKKNRQLRKNLVSYYAKQMKDGQWMLNGEGIIFNEEGILVDGQHRLAAVVESGVNVEMLVVRNADKDSFATIDSGLSRNTSDIFFVKGIPNASNISSIISRYFKLTTNWTLSTRVTSRKGSNTCSRQDLLNEYSKDEDFWQEIMRFAKSCYKSLRIMGECDVGAYSAYLIKVKGHDRDKVYNFFEEVLKKDIPINPMLAAYRRRLMNDRLATTHMGGMYRQQLLIKVWNYYVEGKTTTLMRWNEAQEGKKTFL